MMTPSPSLTTGRIVLYKLSQSDVKQSMRRRVAMPHEAGWPPGARAHVGNAPSVGDVVPAIVVRVWSGDTFNGQAFLDGNDVLWLTSVHQGDGPGQWQWPQRT